MWMNLWFNGICITCAVSYSKINMLSHKNPLSHLETDEMKNIDVQYNEYAANDDNQSDIFSFWIDIKIFTI